VEPSWHPVRIKSQEAQGRKVPNRQQVKARVARKNHRVKAGLSLRPDRIKSQEAQGRKVPNRQPVKARAVRKSHKAELSLHPDRTKSQELDRMALNKQLKRVRKVRGKLKVQVEPSWHPVRIKSQEAQGRKVPNKQPVEARAARKNRKAELSLHPDRKKSQEA
jgi:hypothetical protein